MKRRTMRRFIQSICLCSAMLMLSFSQAQAYDGTLAAQWMEQFALALQALSPVNDPLLTADPARPGEYLLEYEFGSVRARVSAAPAADDILEIDVRTPQVTDCRGVRVGMALEDAVTEAIPSQSSSRLYVLGVQETAWNWAYMGEQGVYGVEHIAYGGEAAHMKEYALTYIVEDGMIAAIRMKASAATQAQAQDGLQTATEIAQRQKKDILIRKNDCTAFSYDDLTVMGKMALSAPVAQLVQSMGEPQSVQSLQQSGGRMAVYAGAAVSLALNERTGEEIVRSISVSDPAVEGPRRLTVGMPVSEAAALFRCDEDVYARGGTLYLEGEALGEPPYGEIAMLDGAQVQLDYTCQTPEDGAAQLLVLAQDGVVTNWQLRYMADGEGGV